MSYRSEWCLAFQGEKVQEFRAWMCSLSDPEAMKLAFMEYLDYQDRDHPPPKQEAVRDLLSCLQVILQFEEKLDPTVENSIQFYDTSTRCYSPWDILINILTRRATGMGVHYSYARVGEDMSDMEITSDGHIETYIHRNIEPPFLPAAKRDN
jgi:hypothetical protein